MNLSEIFRKKIIKDVLTAENNAWHSFIYDTEGARILDHLFSQIELLSYNIVSASHIDEERPGAELPAIYFVSCDKKISEKINKDAESHKYSSISVRTLINPVGLTHTVTYKTLLLDLEVLEPRVFLCQPPSLASLCHVLGVKPAIKYLPLSKNLAASLHEAISQSIKCLNLPDKEIPFIIIDRSVDMYTPLMHFFTFKTAMAEIDPNKPEDPNNGDLIWNQIVYRHLAEVDGVLKTNVSKMQKKIDILNKKQVDTEVLGKMVLDAPQTLEAKEAIEKYYKALEECFKRLGYLKDLVEAEQSLATGHNKQGKAVKLVLDYFFEILRMQNIPLVDRVRLLYLMKAKGIVLTKTEKQILKPFGFRAEDLDVELNVKNQIKQENVQNFVYEMTRYEPVISQLISRFIKGEEIFQESIPGVHEAKPKPRVHSLRKSTMITQENKAAKRIIVVYMTGGCTLEERRVAYSLSDSLGVDILIGSDKTVNYISFMKDLKRANDKK